MWLCAVVSGYCVVSVSCRCGPVVWIFHKQDGRVHDHARKKHKWTISKKNPVKNGLCKIPVRRTQKKNLKTKKEKYHPCLMHHSSNNVWYFLQCLCVCTHTTHHEKAIVYDRNMVFRACRDILKVSEYNPCNTDWSCSLFTNSAAQIFHDALCFINSVF